MIDFNFEQFLCPSGKVDPSHFNLIYDDYVCSNIEKDIYHGLILLEKYAKEGNFNIFYKIGIHRLHLDLIRLANNSEFDLHTIVFELYEIMTDLGYQEVESLLENTFISFLYEALDKQKHNEKEKLTRSYLFSIFSNIFKANRTQLCNFIDQKYYLSIIDEFWDHFELIDEDDDDARICASILKLISILFLNNDLILKNNSNFFRDCSIIFQECFSIDDRIILPAAVQALNFATKVENLSLVYMFYIQRYFEPFFTFVNSVHRSVRLNILSTFLNFKQLDSENLIRIVDSGLFNIELNFNVFGEEELLSFLNLMYHYILKSNEIAERIAFSRTLFEINNFNLEGNNLTFKVKEMLYVVLSELIRCHQINILDQVFSLCPLFIEETIDSFDAIEVKNKIIVLRAYQDLIDYIQYDPNSQIFEFLSGKLYSKEFIESIEQIVQGEFQSDVVNSIARSISSFIKKYLENCVISE
ncbi:hypothetical protein TRFO_30799 [Tritrichomonas foetus]|uniref:Uncharacterized protein n=1 Tax=Tritrichomonas foetus TaxID=1144522 RepID=A0A1J4JSS7_9EUKA|nr:hypothetical protein TRFO_30799 [Tritrichomonas foetus]|eukprot:OHT02183.1 hypothetical protein TRFO_30799 [Tritrichomonas foetus]